MLSIIQHQPAERLLGLVADEDSQSRIVPLPKYQCPSCGEVTVFSVGQRIASPFSDETRLAFDSAESQRSDYWRGVTDFFCRVCQSPVRVVYCITEFHMAAFRYDAVSVYEIDHAA
jgi:hypothetical protein